MFVLNKYYDAGIYEFNSCKYSLFYQISCKGIQDINKTSTQLNNIQLKSILNDNILFYKITPYIEFRFLTISSYIYINLESSVNI